MAPPHVPNGAAFATPPHPAAHNDALPAFNHPTLPPKSPSACLTKKGHNRRHSLPLHFLPPSLWSANTSNQSLVVESEEAAKGEHILDEATAAHRISALRQLNGATPSRHRYAKSTGARNSTFSQPVIVRTYSGAARPRSQQRDIVTTKKQNGNGHAPVAPPNMDLKMPPVEAFSFKGIMDEIRHGVAEDLERIAEICARSKYSLSNQYEVHMPPHGRGEPYMSSMGDPVSNANGGPTLQAIASDDEQARSVGRSSRGGGRRTKSVAYGTLETIMSSSRSSEEEQSRKKPAAELADEVRGRAARKEQEQKAQAEGPEAESSNPNPKHVRSKSATFASFIIDNVQTFKADTSSQTVSTAALISEPARPQTSTVAGLEIPLLGDLPMSPTLQGLMLQKPAILRRESTASTLISKLGPKPSLFDNLSSWLPWKTTHGENTVQAKSRNPSHAEGSLRDLLRTTESDKKGKGVDRAG